MSGPSGYEAVISMLAWVISSMLAVLIAVLGWIGNKLHAELTTIRETLTNTNSTLSDIERDLRDDLSSLDRRVVRVETQLGLCNKERKNEI